MLVALLHAGTCGRSGGMAAVVAAAVVAATGTFDRDFTPCLHAIKT